MSHEGISLVQEAIANREGRHVVRESSVPAEEREIFSLYRAFEVFTEENTPELYRLFRREPNWLSAPDIDTINAVVKDASGRRVNVAISLTSLIFSQFEIKVEDVPDFFLLKRMHEGVVETRKEEPGILTLGKKTEEVISSRPFESDDVIRLTGLLEQLNDPSTTTRHWRLLGESYLKTMVG